MNEPQPGLNLVSVMKVIVREIEVTHDQIQGYYQENSIDKTLLYQCVHLQQLKIHYPHIYNNIIIVHINK